MKARMESTSPEVMPRVTDTNSIHLNGQASKEATSDEEQIEKRTMDSLATSNRAMATRKEQSRYEKNVKSTNEPTKSFREGRRSVAITVYVTLENPRR